MSKVLKGVLIYSFITLGILLVVGMLVFGVMFFTANSSTPFTVFGYKAIYRSRVTVPNASIDTSTYNEDDILNLTINVGNFDAYVILAGDSTNSIIVKKYDNLFGVYSGTYDPSIVTSVSSEQPDGETYEVINANVSVGQVGVVEGSDKLNALVSYGESAVTILVPNELGFKLNLNVTSTTGDVHVSGYSASNDNLKIEIYNLSVTTTTGNLYVNKIGSINQIENDDTEHNYVTMESVYFETDGGHFDLSSIERLSIQSPDADNGKVIEINAGTGYFTFADIISPMRITGDSISLTANVVNTVEQGFNYNSPQGYFKIKQIITEGEGINTIATNMVNIDLQNVTGVTSITTSYGDINIGIAENSLTLISTNGNITISGVSKENIIAESEYGKINVNSYLRRAFFKNDRGTIEAKYAGSYVVGEGLLVETIVPTLEINAEYVTEIETSTGSVTLNNIYNPLLVNISNSAPITVTFAVLPESSLITHEINMGSGTATLKLNTQKPFRVNATGTVSGTGYYSDIATLISTNGADTTFLVGTSATPEDTILFEINAGSGRIILQEI